MHGMSWEDVWLTPEERENVRQLLLPKESKHGDTETPCVAHDQRVDSRGSE